MPDERNKDDIPEEFGDVADDTVEAGIADEVAGYDQAMKPQAKPDATDTSSPDTLGDFV